MRVRLWPFVKSTGLHFLCYEPVNQNNCSTKPMAYHKFGTGIWAKAWTSIQWLLMCTLSANILKPHAALYVVVILILDSGGWGEKYPDWCPIHFLFTLAIYLWNINAVVFLYHQTLTSSHSFMLFHRYVFCGVYPSNYPHLSNPALFQKIFKCQKQICWQECTWESMFVGEHIKMYVCWWTHQNSWYHPSLPLPPLETLFMINARYIFCCVYLQWKIKTY